MRYTSYAGCYGTWLAEPFNFAFTGTYSPGINNNSNFQAMQANVNGIFSLNRCYNISAITDGTSNTILFGEKAQGKFSQTNNGGGNASDYNSFGFWADAYSFDTAFTTMYPINPFNKVALDAQGVNGTLADDWVEAASSFHPGGANVVLAVARRGSSRTRSI